ncbi:unnamed protein product [Psylliodes chrysocephalus]|uniref:Lysosomal Pro-X carboxypeptidase n=1 Tax=Psylliodes chrysocephalus TaxID=3402493 RepID=A0A9P0D477_9CUCU|nr:unnamed protein product [Psylliodes chrysocephala]
MYTDKLLLVFMFSALNAQFSQTKYNFETKYIEVPLDHFASIEEPNVFNLRYLINAEYYNGTGPIFIYTGGKGDIFVQAQNTGFMFDIAPIFNALLVFVEHRYYGQSLPFGNDSFSSLKQLKYLSTTQALADFASVSKYLKDIFSEIDDLQPTVVAFGASYSGMLAAWLRMKYPYLVTGTIASSAPMFDFPGLIECDMFYEKITQVYDKNGGEECVEMIKRGWDVITALSKTKIGRGVFSELKICSKIENSKDVEKLLNWLQNIYVNMALANYNYPTNLYTPLPAYPVKVFCNKLTSYYEISNKSFIQHYSRALELYTNYTGNNLCNNINYINEDLTEIAWNYQKCTELIRPRCSTENDMFVTKPWDYEKYAQNCNLRFGVKDIRPEWTILAYGGKNLKYFSNIVFSYGDMDPWSSATVLDNVSDSIFSINIPDATNQLDLRKFDLADNNYVAETRKFHIRTITQWLENDD